MRQSFFPDFEVTLHFRYFQAAYPTSIERHVFSIALVSAFVPLFARQAEASAPTPVTDTSIPSYYHAQFSPNGRFYVLSYEGPQVPWQRVYDSNNKGM